LASRYMAVVGVIYDATTAFFPKPRKIMQRYAQACIQLTTMAFIFGIQKMQENHVLAIAAW
jgi:hypothetical protein